MNEVSHEKPAGGFTYLNQRVALDCPSPDQIERIAEAKATRDVLVHHRGVANPTYAAEAGPRARHPPGERVEVPESYQRQL